VFFGLAGAGLHLDALWRLGPWIVLIIGLRTVALRAGLRWAGHAPNVTPILARSGWMGLISQAGLALGMATVVRRAFPAWGVSLEALILAMIGVHELVGPILLRRALRLAGEATEATHVSEGPAVERATLPLAGSRV
jgi:hypothetical protein